MLKKMQLNPGWSNHDFMLFCGFYHK